MNCDPIARIYRPVEYCAFGRTLERHRFHFLSQLTNLRSALLLGDGDGRFAEKLSSANPGIQIHSVDASAKMIALARRRTASDRIQFFHTNIENFHPPPQAYDLIVANFFFDCFSTDAVRDLIKRLKPACCAEATWIVSEFDQPPAGWKRLHSQLWLRVMYRFFGIATGLRIARLPDYRSALAEAGFVRGEHFNSRAGLICSERWQLSN